MAKALTVAGMVDAYLDWSKDYYVDAEGRPSAGLGPVGCAAKILKELYGPTVASEFGPLSLKALRLEMIERNLCRNVINQRVGCMKRMFRWAVGEELVPGLVLHALSAVAPLRRGRSAARDTKPVRPVPDEQVEAVLRFLPGTLQAMVRLQRVTGMRSGELCILRTRDVDISGKVWVYRPSSHKTAYRDQERLVRIGPKGQKILQPFLRPQTLDAFIFTPAQAHLERLAMRQGGTSHRRARGVESRDVAAVGDRYKPRSYRRALNYAFRQAIAAKAMKPEQRWHPHQLRHRHATEIRQARGLEAARVLLGHRTLSQTLEYAEADAALACSLALDLG